MHSIAKGESIALVSNSAWSVYNFRLDVIRCLLSNGYRLIVIAPNDSYSELLIEEGCTFIPLDFDNRGLNALSDVLFYRRLKTIYRKINPSFIFHYVAKPNIYGSLAAAALNIPSVAVITGLGYPFAKKNWLYGLMKILYKKALRRAFEVWFLNNEDARVFINQRIIPINNVKVLHGEGINTSYFSIRRRKPASSKDPFVFLMSTRLLKSKGIGIYVDAARILIKKGYHAKCLLVGFFERHHPDSIDENDLVQWEREGLISYKGFAPDVRIFLGQANCFVFPSFYNEGIPRCLMEAASMELPIITSFNRGCKEVVMNNVSGYLCRPHDPFDLADKMEIMLNLSPDQRATMGRNGRHMVKEKFNISRIQYEYIQTLQSGAPD